MEVQDKDQILNEIGVWFEGDIYEAGDSVKMKNGKTVDMSALELSLFDFCLAFWFFDKDNEADSKLRNQYLLARDLLMIKNRAAWKYIKHCEEHGY